ncbi:MAG: hypothetical protein AN484_16850 [Aphanizomenon flos-aquae WA102]|uniref:Uncharacterized protein n=1 Tax=Aphanizomenon flos-aquae WA102 TaxID=1710896 RepID=A0A1B7WZQ3_APHFL|nr:MAG: hypothetical protein AN484_16850 [Aphanizomenon flos-aquae WA102]
MNCGNCLFFQGTQFGHCRRYPESVTKQAGMWCGEHKVDAKPLPIREELASIPVPAPKRRKKNDTTPA